MTPKHAIAEYVLGRLTSEQIASLAHRWLEQGKYSDHLNYIISEPVPVMSEIGQHFENAIREFGIRVPTQTSAIRLLVHDIVNQMVSREVDLVEGANQLYDEFHITLGDELPEKEFVGDGLGLEKIFAWLREIWDIRDGSMTLYYTDLSQTDAELKFIEHLGQEAKLWLNSNPPVLED